MRLPRTTLRVSGAFFLAFTLAIGSVAHAATCNVPSGSYATIQSAIDDGTCSTIVVAPGTYTENLHIDHSVTINGDSSTATIVDGGGVGPVVALNLGTSPITLNHLTLTGGSSGVGGGVYLNYAMTVNLNYCTVTANEAVGLGEAGASGGGIYVANGGTVNLFNSTVAGNAARASLVGIILEAGFGGGIENNSATVNVLSSTIVDNLAEDGDSPGEGGGIAGVAALTNTIVARNSGGNCSVAQTDNGYNMSSDATCSFSGTGSANSVPNLNLDTLKNNGGPTKTIALLTGSAAIDQIASGTNGCGTTVPDDQRGVPRPQNGNCDIGAFEVCKPSVICPADSSASADANCQAQIPNVLPGVTTADNCVPGNTPQLQQDPTAGTLVGLGPHTITVTATDAFGNTSTCTTTFTVNDTTPPVVTSSLSVFILGNDHTMKNVGYSESANDNCGGNLSGSVLVEIYSSEQEQTPTPGGGDGTTSPDARGLGTCYNSSPWYNQIAVRQERLNNGSGRIYLIKTSATDGSNNTAWSCATVVSPRSSKRNDMNKVLAAASAVKTVCDQFGAIPTNYYLIGCGPVIGSKQ